jgi:glyoxylase-like metal-dependent hydrolase (beta-lactamase superfamily II)
MKITEDIFQVGGSEFTSSEDAAIYLVNLGGHAALIDAGCGHAQKRLLENITACGVDPGEIEYILITHCHYDHVGGVRALKDHIRCRVVAHELEAPFMEQGDNTVTGAKWYGSHLEPFSVDIKLTLPKEKINLGDRQIEAIHIPGHSPGSVAYLTESDGYRVLFGQDVHGPLDANLLSNRKDYLQSLNLLLSLEADILCEGHFGIFKGKQEIRDFIESFTHST